MWYILHMNKRAQNTIEYLLLVVAMITVMIIFLAPNGKYQKGMQNTLNQVTTDAIAKANSEILF